MSELKYQELDQYLNKLSENNIPHVFLIWGEQYLTKKAFDKVLDSIIPKNKRQLGYEPLEGEDANIPEIIERISTFSIVQDKLVIAARDVPIFPASGGSKVYGFSKHNLKALEKLIKTGFPPHHYLILTTSASDKRRSLFKTLKTYGIVIDCSIPKGNRQSDQNQQINTLRGIMHSIIGKNNKTMDNNAFKALIDKTGFNPAVFADNLEKLTAFVGKKKEIDLKDIEKLVSHTKQEPIFELTNAISQKNTERALFCNKSLLNSGFHPLQILTAMANNIRKLILVKNFIERSNKNGRKIWWNGQNYNQFQYNTMPEIIKYDKKFIKKLLSWNDEALKKSENNFKEILIAPNPKNTYPIYQTFLKSDNFSMEELAKALIALGELDFALKSSSGASDILLTNIIIKICNA